MYTYKLNKLVTILLLHRRTATNANVLVDFLQRSGLVVLNL